MLSGEENAREMLRRFGDRRQFVDPADDLIAEGCRIHHAFPKAAPIRDALRDRYKSGAQRAAESKGSPKPPDW
jgi:hypothetical protein